MSFAPEKAYVVQCFPEAIRLAEEEFRVQHVWRDLTSVRLHPELPLIAWNGQWHRLTRRALLSTLALADIPANFSCRAPWDLVVHCFERMKRSRRIILAIGRHDVLLNVMPARRTVFFTASDLLRDLHEKVVPFFELREILISDAGLEVRFISPQLILEPKPGDVLHVGVRILSSETEACDPCAMRFLLRLVCQNGLVLNREWGVVKFDLTLDYRRGLEQFVEQVGQLLTDEGVLAACRRSEEISISVGELLTIWRKVRAVLGRDEADRILQLGHEEVRLLQSADRSEPSGRSVWEVLNAVTAAARELDDIPRRQRLEALAGHVFSLARRGRRT